MPDLNKVNAEKEDFVFVSLCASSLSEIDENMQKVDNNGLKRIKSKNEEEVMYYDIIPDAKEIADAYGITAFPVTIVIDKNGTITNTISYTVFSEFPDEMITYRLIKKD